MSKIGNYLLEPQYCIVCGREFLPAAVRHTMDSFRYPTCSAKCEEDRHDMFNNIADQQKEYDYDEIWDSYKEREG